MSRTRVAIGVPVYNGARTLASALDSLLAQDFTDTRLFISDNGSTDETRAIAADYARRHPNVEYHRADENRGAIWNFNRVFELGCDADYFCWAAHDDVRAPSYLRKCVAQLEIHPTAALCHSQIILERPGSHESPVIEKAGLVADSASPRARFAATLDGRPWHLLAYGLFRVTALQQTQLYRSLVGADLGLISELALYGSFLQVEEPLFTYRLANDVSMEAYFQRLQRVLDPNKRFGKLQSYRVGVARAHIESILRAPISAPMKLGALADLMTTFGFSKGTLDELLRIATSLLGVERFEQLRTLKRRLLQR